MRRTLRRASRVWLMVVVACGVVAHSLAQTNRPDILWMDSVEGGASDVIFSPTQDLLATVGAFATVKIWRVDNGTLVRTLRNLPATHEFVSGAAFSPDGSTIAIAGCYGTIQILRISDGTLVRTLQPQQQHPIPYQEVAFSPDGRYTATGGRGYALATIWRVDTGEQIAVLGNPANRRDAVNSFAFSPDSRLLAVSMASGSVFVWRIPECILARAILAAHTGQANSVDFSPDGAFLLTAGDDNTVRLWRVADGGLERIVAQGRYAQFSPDGTLIVSILPDIAQSRLHRVADGALVATIPAFGYPAFSRDGQLITFTRPWHLSAPVTIWRVPEGTLARQLPNEGILNFTYSPDGTLIAAPLKSSGVAVRNATDGTLVRVVAPERQFVQAVIAPDNNLLATWERAPSSEGTTFDLNLRRISNGTVVRSLGRFEFPFTPHISTMEPAFSSDGTLLAALVQINLDEQAVRIWRVQDGTVAHELRVPRQVSSFALSPDAARIALLRTQQHESTLEVRRVQDGALLFSQRVPIWGQTRVQFSVDGEYLAVLGILSYVWRATNFELVRTITPPLSVGYPCTAALSPDGALVAIFADETVRLVRVADGAVLASYNDETGIPGVHSGLASYPQIRFSPSGQQFAFLRADATWVVARNPYSTPQVAGDMNGDGCVNNADLLLVLFHFGNTGGTGDANRDGTVNNTDLLMVLFNFGHGC